MTPDQKLARTLDALSWVLEHAKCIESRRFVAKVLRELDQEEPRSARLGFTSRPREHVPSDDEIRQSFGRLEVA